ncbi:deleted in malignant brain tumors 1 protein [Cololabis saira]|uniref:deleted in malignant brain tumors 1 protein n=1 Tax=Cololabis saira TaxID=129043 RepID=UPI002AD20804|nr:deleted in malignant brain tumors 1 protein [Cololabis saira]
MWTLLFLCSVLATHGVTGWRTTWGYDTATAEWTTWGYDRTTAVPCGGYLYSSSGSFYSPNYPNNYTNNAICTWYIRAGQHTRLEFSNVNLECDFDDIFVYDGPSTSSRLLGRYCSSRKTVFYSTGYYLTVRFRSDHSITYSGFRANYNIGATSSPGTDMTTDQSSCRYNCGYSVGSCSCRSNCEYYGNCCNDYYSYCPATTVATTEPATDTTQPSCRYNCGYSVGSCSCRSNCEYYGNCCPDYYSHCGRTTDVPTTAQPSCRRNCGSHMGSCSCSSSCRYNGNCCYDYYSYCYWTTPLTTTPSYQTSQSSCRGNCGYHMGSCSCSSSCRYNGNCCHDYYSYCAATTPEPCGGSLFGSGTFSSPNHPNYYNDNAYCVWHLRSAHDQRIFLAFTYLQLENCCNCDYISVYDGPSVGSRLLGKVCNDSLSSFSSSSNHMTVVFRSDRSVVGRGFSAEFLSSLKPNAGRVDCSADKMNIVIERSYLNSLGYDGHSLYLNDPHCRPQVSSFQVVFSFPLNTCGNIRQFVHGRIMYTNNVRAYPSHSGEIIRQSHLKMNVTCVMDQDSVSQIMYVVRNLENSTITGSGRYNTSMAFYKTRSFYDKVTEDPYEVTLNQRLFVQVQLRRRESTLRLFIDTCVASPSPFDFNDRAYYLVRDGCKADSTYYPISSSTPSLARFEFKAFQFLRATDSVYIRCKVLICPVTDHNSRCSRGCSRRAARDVQSEHDSHTLVVGPIKLKESEKKEEGTEKQNEA